MFTQVKDFKAFSDPAFLTYVKTYHSVAELYTNELVDSADYVLRNLYGRVTFNDKYDSGNNLGIGNVKKLIDRVTKAVTKEYDNGGRIKLPLAITQLNECASDLANLLISPNDSYTAFGTIKDQQYVMAVAKKMSEDSNRFNHFDHLLKAIKCILHYGFAAMKVDYVDDPMHQIKINDSTSGSLKGNKITVVNPANIYYTKVNDMRLFSETAEYCSVIETVTKTGILKQAMHADIDSTVIENLLKTGSGTQNPLGSLKHPMDYEYLLDFNPFAEEEQTVATKEKHLIKTTVYIRVTRELLTKEIEELPSFSQKLIRLTYIGNVLVNAEISNNGVIPVIVCPLVKGSTAATSVIPAQKFINFLINVKQQGDKKRIFGLNFYDRNKINMNDITKAKETDNVSPYIPVALEKGENLGSAIQHFNDAPDTSRVLSDIVNMKDLMQIILPTDTSSLMGGLERATEWQAKKALEQSGKVTKLLGRALQAGFINPLTALQIQLIFDNEATIDVVEEDGSVMPKSKTEFADKDIIFNITTALNGVDRDIKAQQMDSFINKLIQLPAVSQEYDLTKLFDYQSSLTGHKIDFSQFKLQSPIDALGRQEKDIAYQLLQQYMVEQQQAKQPKE